jgi:hypothetical protein
MNEHFAQNLMKAARAGMTDYAPAADWQGALDAYARKCARPGESYEQSYARVTANDPDGVMMARAERAAAHGEMAKFAQTRVTGRAPDRTPREVIRDASEELLAKRATARAQVEKCSFEVAFTRELDSPEGAELYAAAMR